MACSGDKQRQDAQPAFVLHTYPFRETSLVVEVFTRNFGRVGLVARGARRPRSALRGLLMAFPAAAPVLGRQIRAAHAAQGGMAGRHSATAGPGLMCGFYLNELLLKLLARDDPHEDLFDHLPGSDCWRWPGEPEPAATLRRFEKHLLKELGYALTLDREADTGRPIDPQKRYTYVIERGPVALDRPCARRRWRLTGRRCSTWRATISPMPSTLAQSKLLMRF